MGSNSRQSDAPTLRGRPLLVALACRSQLYETSTGTLCAQPSLLSTLLCTGGPLPRDSDGSIFLDRDGHRFANTWLQEREPTFFPNARWRAKKVLDYVGVPSAWETRTSDSEYPEAVAIVVPSASTPP